MCWAEGVPREVVARSIVLGVYGVPGQVDFAQVVTEEAMAEPELTLVGDVRYTSPWVLSVWAALHEKGLPFRMETVDLEAGENRREEHARRMIASKVPALRHGRGWLGESLAILEYLEEAFPASPRLLPADRWERARDREILAWLRSDLFELRRAMPFEGIFLRLEPPPITAQAREEAARLLAVVATRAPSVRPTLADFDLAFTVRRLVHYGYDLAVYPGAVALSAAIWARPSVASWVAVRR